MAETTTASAAAADSSISLKKGGKGMKKCPCKSNSVRAGVEFPVGRIARYLRKGSGSTRLPSAGSTDGGLVKDQRLSRTAAVYMASALEYMTAEILELAGNEARLARGLSKSGRVIVLPRDIKNAVDKDHELLGVFAGFCLGPQAGVLARRVRNEDDTPGHMEIATMQPNSKAAKKLQAAVDANDSDGPGSRSEESFPDGPRRPPQPRPYICDGTTKYAIITAPCTPPPGSIWEDMGISYPPPFEPASTRTHTAVPTPPPPPSLAHATPSVTGGSVVNPGEPDSRSSGTGTASSSRVSSGGADDSAYLL